MNYKPILVVAGEPNSIFLEIFFKSLKSYKSKKPIILIASLKLLKLQMKKLNYKKKINIIETYNLKKKKLDNKSINLMDVKYNQRKAFEKSSKKSNSYIEKSFNLAIKLIKDGFSNKLINGPISKKNFLNKKYLGITEYLSKKLNTQNNAMLIYNKKLSVCPITTHLPLKLVEKKIKKKIILDKVKLINDFFLKNFSYRPKIAILGLNPHCESILRLNEDEKIIKPVVKKLKKLKFSVSDLKDKKTVFYGFTYTSLVLENLDFH